MSFQIVIPAFSDGGAIPPLYTGEGADLSPAIEWSGEPAGAESFVLIVDDPDAPGGTWNHWLLYDIPASVHHLAQGWKPAGPGVSGTNDFGRLGYGGPMPPRGHGPHRYYFRLFAVDRPSLGLAEGVKRAKLDRALKGHVLGQAEYMGRFERR